jgi:leucyl-tRNA synthetase
MLTAIQRVATPPLGRAHVRMQCLAYIRLLSTSGAQEPSGVPLHSLYDHERIERKWKERWSASGNKDHYTLDGTAQQTSNKQYVLSMFPYPSGKLHMGHVRVYTISDTIARMCRMVDNATTNNLNNNNLNNNNLNNNNNNVNNGSHCNMPKGHILHPMGWDAFGLPAENAAVAHQVDPATWTRNNIATMKQQLQMISTTFDWDAEVRAMLPVPTNIDC